jgi:hypothetical protein
MRSALRCCGRMTRRKRRTHRRRRTGHRGGTRGRSRSCNLRRRSRHGGGARDLRCRSRHGRRRRPRHGRGACHRCRPRRGRCRVRIARASASCLLAGLGPCRACHRGGSYHCGNNYRRTNDVEPGHRSALRGIPPISTCQRRICFARREDRSRSNGGTLQMSVKAATTERFVGRWLHGCGQPLTALCHGVLDVRIAMIDMARPTARRAHRAVAARHSGAPG